VQHSVASVYFSNGTAVNIAKIPGGPAYKQIIRATEVLDSHATAYYTWFGDILEVGTRAAQAFFGLQSLGNLLSLRLSSRDTHS
jgi:3-deoxy-D-arabino-heptulosonate 7-phosphate (DAHP) synthase